jgi:hypothetical protein
MATIKVTVSYSETASLPGYNNIRPSVGFEVETEADISYAKTKAAELLEHAKGMVKEEIGREKLLYGFVPYDTGEDQQEPDWDQPPLEHVDDSGDTNLVREPQSSAVEGGEPEGSGTALPTTESQDGVTLETVGSHDTNPFDKTETKEDEDEIPF